MTCCEIDRYRKKSGRAGTDRPSHRAAPHAGYCGKGCVGNLCGGFGDHFEKISPHLPLAVVSSEDNLFTQHNGFDFKAIEQARHDAQNGKRLRGASTISQQTAKNVFLWNGRSWLRKGLEAYYTMLIELIWGKERIMEVYLNCIEMGNGIYGASAVAQHHFDKKASQLSRNECALIAASLPNPRKMNSSRPSKYMYKRQKAILRLMRLIGEVKYK